MTDKPKVAIEYCPECKFMLRAGWLAQELLQAFEQELGEVAIRPRSGGDLIVRVGARVLFSRKAAGRFVDAKEIKRLVAEAIGSGRIFGHQQQ